jgi:hypothetical protein
LDLDLAVDDDRADAGRHRALDLGDRLVVAVESEPRGFGARGQRDGELAAGAHVDAEARLGDPAHDRRGEERLARVIDRHGRVDGCRGRLERGEDPRSARPRVGLVDHVERRAESLGELGDGDAGHDEAAVGVAVRALGPHLRGQGIGVIGHAEPSGYCCGGCHGETSTGREHRQDRSRRANPDWFLKPAACRPCGAGYGESTEARQAGRIRDDVASIASVAAAERGEARLVETEAVRLQGDGRAGG